MRIDNLKLQNFRCFDDLDLNFVKPINFIFGPNASGKSTIAEAMEMALTGRCNGFNPNWRARAALARHGSDTFKIQLDIDGDRSPLGSAPIKKVIHRPELKDCSPGPDAIAKKLHVSKEVLAALFDTGHFFSLHPDEKKRVIFDLLDLKVTKANIKRKLKSWLKEHPGLIEKFQVDPDEDLLSFIGTTPDSLESAYSQAFDERRLVKRELKAMGPTVPACRSGRDIPIDIPDGIAPEEIKSRIDQNQRELSSLHERLGQRRGILSFEKRRIETEIEKISSTLGELKSDVKGFKPRAEKTRLSSLEKKKDETLQEIESRTRELESCREEINRLRVERKAEEKLILKLREFNGNCPLFDRPIECKTDEVLSAISEFLNGERSLNGQVETLAQKAAEIRKLIGTREHDLSTIQEDISASKERLSQYDDNLERINELEKKKAEMERSLSECTRDDSEGLRDRIRQVEEELEKDRALLLTIQDNEKRKALTHKLNALEVLVQAFSPKGIMADLLSKAVRSLNESLAQTMKKLTSGKYSLEINVNPARQSGGDDVDIHLIDHHNGTRTNVRLASSSERFRAGIVIQSVLSGLTGLRFMLIDGLDILDQENKGFFFRFIQEAKKDFDNIFVFSTIGQYAPQNPNLPDVDFWVIQDGHVRKIPVSLRKGLRPGGPQTPLPARRASGPASGSYEPPARREGKAA